MSGVGPARRKANMPRSVPTIIVSMWHGMVSTRTPTKGEENASKSAMARKRKETARVES